MDEPFPSQPVSPEMAESVMAAQPFSRHLEARLLAFSPGSASLVLDVRPFHLQQHGRVHGGVLAYLVDNAVTFAAGSVLGPQVVTASVDVSYLGAARGPVLVAHARVEHSTRRSAHCAVRVVEVDGLDDLAAAADPGDGTTQTVALGHGQVRRLREAGERS